MNETEKTTVTKPSEYRKAHNNIKKITLPSGSVFEIRKFSVREYIASGGVTLISPEMLVGSGNIEEKSKILWEKMTPEQKKGQLEANDRMICLAVLNPKMVMNDKTPAENELQISDLSDTDYFALLKMISEFSFTAKDTEFFREKPDASNP